MTFDSIFLDKTNPTKAQAFDGLFDATVTGNATTTAADVALFGFDSNFGTPTYNATFEPRFGSSGSPQAPPVGTHCLVAFTTPIAYVAGKPKVGSRATVWIVAFGGWPD